MVDDVLALADRLWRGEVPTAELHPVGHLAWLAGPADPQAREAKRQVFTIRTDRATSTMAKGVFRWAAGEAEGKAGL